MIKSYTYLALGDSYTIGEGVTLYHSFPYQVVQILRRSNYHFSAPEIMAQTGWTSDELMASLDTYHFLPKYDIVSLLIGVNNQYRGRLLEEYKLDFENLLKKSIHLAGSKKENVLVLSIPDYSTTPLRQGKDPDKIAKEIDLFNSLNKAISVQYKVPYIDVTSIGRLEKKDETYLSADNLHPSKKEYTLWAEKVADVILAMLK
ncbi:MAG: SGNH/GDSL hydrolase family protein [Flavisolibacter sp.]|nr:SGNH/GDSL hydrolase family protein [Flavisolibacter sp.]